MNESANTPPPTPELTADQGEQGRETALAPSHQTPPNVSTRPRGRRRDWKPAFLQALAGLPNVRAACQTVGVARPTVYERRKADPVFAKAWDAAIDEAVDILEEHAWQRATTGTPTRPVVKRDGTIIEVMEVSDTLMMFLLKAHRRDKYGDRLDLADSRGKESSVDAAIESLAKELRQAGGMASPAAAGEGAPAPNSPPG